MKVSLSVAVCLLLSACRGLPQQPEPAPKAAHGPAASTAATDGPASQHAAMLGASAPGPAEATPAAPPNDVPAATYAALFDQNRRWGLTGTLTTTVSFGPTPETTKTPFSATCSVADVERFSWGQLSQVNCAGLPDVAATSLLEGTWVATREGLFHFDQRPDTSTLELPPASKIMAASPVAFKEDFSQVDDVTHIRTLEHTKGGWCFEAVTALGDEAWRGVCITESGFASGGFGWAGGSTQEVTFTASLR